MRRGSIIVKLAVMAGSFVAMCGTHLGEARLSAAEPGNAPFAVSKETTWLVEPLDAEGYVDYIEAVNQRTARDVTVANNFEVIARELLGPDSIPEVLREDYFRRLGVTPQTDPKRPFKPFSSFPPQNDRAAIELFKEDGIVSSQPWSPTDHPRAAQWLQSMQPALDYYVEGTKRTRLYTPYVTVGKSSDRVLSDAPTFVTEHRQLANALSIRIFSRIQSGDIDGALDDIQALHRHARLVSQGTFLIEGLVGKSIAGVAAKGEAAILQSKRLTLKQSRRHLDMLKSLKPLPTSSQFILSERFSALDATQSIACDSAKKMPAPKFAGLGPGKSLSGYDIDWDTPLKLLNVEYDAISEAFNEPDPVARYEKVLAYTKRDKERYKAQSDSLLTRGFTFLAGGPKARGRLLGETIFRLYAFNFRDIAQSDNRTEARFAVTRVGFALDVYRRTKGQVPKSLDDLAPAFLDSIPLDPYTGKSLVYHPGRSAAFVVYSVGTNKRDDAGKDRNVASDPNLPDDFAIEAPALRP